MTDASRLDRRGFLRLAGLVAACSVASACLPSAPLQGRFYSRLAGEPGPLAPWPPIDPAGFSLLRRLTFGPSLQERQRLAEVGPQAWIEEQLDFEAIDDEACALRLRAVESLTMSAAELAAWSDKLFDDVDRVTVPDELRQATVIRQLTSRRQLFERMADFWTDHFSISVDKGECFYLKTVDDREVVRRHTLGRFGDLLQASAHSPAMLVYLDNQANRAGAPNENYARELLELHTLGVDGGYSQQDVMELARCLTGWSVKDHFWHGQFTFQPEQHDHGEKRLLGRRIQPGGLGEAESILVDLASHPSTARFLAAKLIRRFVADPPPQEVVQRAARRFLETNGDLRQVMRVVLLEGLSSMQPKFTRPSDFVISALRQLHARVELPGELLRYFSGMGQPYFGWPTPDGYPDRDDAWSHNLLPRWQFALSLAQDEIPGVILPWEAIRQHASDGGPAAVATALSTLLLGTPLAPEASKALIEQLQQGGATEAEDIERVLLAGLIASPAFQWR